MLAKSTVLSVVLATVSGALWIWSAKVPLNLNYQLNEPFVLEQKVLYARAEQLANDATITTAFAKAGAIERRGGYDGFAFFLAAVSRSCVLARAHFATEIELTGAARSERRQLSETKRWLASHYRADTNGICRDGTTCINKTGSLFFLMARGTRLLTTPTCGGSSRSVLDKAQTGKSRSATTILVWERRSEKRSAAV